MSRRLERVAGQLREEIARVLREQVTDPRVQLVTVTQVSVSPDLRNATVFWSRMETDASPALELVAAGLASASPFVRQRLARALPLKRMPALHFRFDPSLELGDRTLRALRSLHDETSG